MCGSRAATESFRLWITRRALWILSALRANQSLGHSVETRGETRVRGHHRLGPRHRPPRVVLVRLLAGDLERLQQRGRRQRPTRGRRAVVHVGRTRHQRLGIRRRVIETALEIGEVLRGSARSALRRGPSTRRPDARTRARPPHSPRGSPAPPRRPRPARPAPSGRRPEGAPPQRLGRPLGRQQRIPMARPRRVLGERRDRQTVPGRDHLVVAARLGAAAPGREQPVAHRLQRALSAGSRGSCSTFAPCSKFGLAGAIPNTAAAQAASPHRGPPQLRHRPGVGQTLDAVSVGVEAAAKAPSSVANRSSRNADGIVRDPREQVAPVRRHSGIQPQQLGIVVEHLLEVRHHPRRIDAVASKAAAELVVDPAARHRPAA